MRGYRRVAWIETAVEPVRERLGLDGFERLVSMLAVVAGWDAYIVLTDVRGLDHQAACAVTLAAALALLDAALGREERRVPRVVTRRAGQRG
jgi:hypothetical protein